MRIRSLSATALAAAAFLHPANVLAQHDVVYHAANVVQAAAETSIAVTTSTVTTFTLTRTVMRVVETATVTRQHNKALTAAAVPSASLTLMPYVNGTSSVLGANATPTAKPSSAAAGRIGVDTVGWAAMVGLVGLVVA